MKDAVQCFEPALAEYISKVELPPTLRDAVSYAVLGGGKRLRPGLLLLCCDAVGGKRAEAMPAAIAIELIHCFSLVHDDLPAMDDDDLRRGRPTLHVHAGEAMAVLAGDVMLSLAFQVISTYPGLDELRRIHIINELSKGTTAMIGGQVFDTLGGFADDLDPEQCLRLTHHNKTAALLRAACRMGAIAGHAETEQLNRLSRYGESVGLMFQVVDDLLDVTQSSEHLGKTAGKDEAAGKLTFPALLGVEASRHEVARLRREAGEALNGIITTGDALMEVIEYLAARTR